MAKTLRAFVALPLPQEIVDFLSRLQHNLRSQGLKIGWVRPENLHLTLKFLGDIAQDDVPSICETLERATSAVSAPELTVQGLGIFPGMKRPRVLWAGLGGQTRDLEQLHRRVEEALASVGYMPEKRSFRAHLTLGRIRKPVDPKWLLGLVSNAGNYTPMAYTARQLVFYKSDLRPTGAVHTALSTLALTGK